jgi:uncharacterized protein YbaR (Trm112 family)
MGAADPYADGEALLRSYQGRRTKKMPRHFFESLRLDDDPRWVRFIPGNYETRVYIPERDDVVSVNLPYYRYRRHYDPSIRKMIPCSSGDDPDFAAKPCIGCSKLGADTVQEVYAFTVIHLDWFHEVPWIKNGEVQINKATGKPFTNLVPCEGKNCRICRTDGEDSRIFGRRQHLSLSYTQNNHLRIKSGRLKRYCRCGDELLLSKLKCPQCKQVLIDTERTDLSEQDVKDFRKNGMMCPKCKRHMQVVDEYDCDCGEPRPVSMFDVDISIAKIKLAEKKTSLEIDFSRPGPLDDNYQGDKTPYDFSEVFSPPNIESQRMLYNYQGPVTNASEEKVAEKY